MAVQQVIAGIRQEKGLTQQQMAESLYVTRQAVSRWETGESKPTVDMCKLIAATYGVPVAELLEMPEELGWCQSCGMPFFKDEHHGTEADGSPSEDYCSWCYKDGHWIGCPTQDEMIERSAPYMAEGTEMSTEEAVSFLGALYPTLKRWQA